MHLRIALPLIIALFSFTHQSFSQTGSPSKVLDHLIPGTWQCTGTWGDGSPFKQEITYTWDIPDKIIHSITYGNTSQTGYEWGARNSGIRQVEQEKFWEFDVFGGLTTGSFQLTDSHMIYTYDYDSGQGNMTLTDLWEMKNPNEFELKTGVYTDGTWKMVYMNATCVRQ